MKRTQVISKSLSTFSLKRTRKTTNMTKESNPSNILVNAEGAVHLQQHINDITPNQMNNGINRIP